MEPTGKKDKVLQTLAKFKEGVRKVAPSLTKSKDVSDLLARITKTESKTESNELNILKELSDIKTFLLHLLVQVQSKEISQAIAPVTQSKKEAPALSQKEALEELDKVAASKLIENKKFYLLFRPTENFEYDKSADGHEFTTKSDSEWTHDEMSSVGDRDGKNPVVGAYVAADSIKEIRNPRTNNSALGDFAQNPHHKDFVVVVKPGTYKIYSELKT